MEPIYLISAAPRSHCPDCSAPVRLLATRNVDDGPAFYVCTKCAYIGQVGVGRVTEVR